MADKQYLDLLSDVLENGVEKENRTGVNTISVFGRQLRFDLKKGFPILTTKKVHFKSVVHELLWFLKGTGNINYLNDNGVKIWNDWADEDGNLGPVYGVQWRNWKSFNLVSPNIFEYEKPNRSEGKVGYLGDDYKTDETHELLYPIWLDIIEDCYGKDSSGCIFMDKNWLNYSNFYRDCQKLRNWNLKKTFPSKYYLDKDYYISNKYGLETCMWSNVKQQDVNKINIISLENKVPKDYYISNKYGLETCMWSNVKQQDAKLPRVYIADQIDSVISEIKQNPSSRRILLSAWNPVDLEDMKLAPCHYSAIFNVSHGKLSCMFTMRSIDTFLGLPFNIASYALLTHMIAQVCNLDVGDLIWCGGDTHIYCNHLDQVKEQLSRKPYDLPTLNLNKNISDIDSFEFKHISLENYKHHAAIKAAIAV